MNCCQIALSSPKILLPTVPIANSVVLYSGLFLRNDRLAAIVLNHRLQATCLWESSVLWASHSRGIGTQVPVPI